MSVGSKMPALDPVEASPRAPPLTRERREGHERRRAARCEELVDTFVRLDRIVLTGQKDYVIERGTSHDKLGDPLQCRPDVSEPTPVACVAIEKPDRRKFRQ